jgi:hypothetical protein
MNHVAEERNKQLQSTDSRYVNIAERYIETIVPRDQTYIIEKALEVFKKNNPGKMKWEDFEFPTVGYSNLHELVMDVTIQRFSDIEHLAGIIKRFDPCQFNPIKVWKEPVTGKIVAWEGQHTSLSVHIIFHLLMCMPLEEIIIPIIIYPIKNRAQARQVFINDNTTNRKSFESVDVLIQHVMGVRTDGNITDPIWILNERKQQELEKAGMFFTSETFGDTAENGALSNMTEFFDKSEFGLKYAEAFCKYFTKICQAKRPVASAEVWLIFNYLKQCYAENIVVDDAYIDAFCKSLNVAFNNNFKPEMLINHATDSYRRWWTDISGFDDLRSSPGGNTADGKKFRATTFLIAQIAKNMPKNFAVPQKYHFHWNGKVPVEDLFPRPF